MRWVADGRPMGAGAARFSLGRVVAHWEDHGFGVWAAVPHGEDSPVGFVGLAVPFFLPAVMPAVEVGWRFDRAWWGQGLATEGGAAAIAWAFGSLGLDRVISIIRPENVASVRVAEKLGMVPGPSITHPAYAWDLSIYEKYPVIAE